MKQTFCGTDHYYHSTFIEKATERLKEALNSEIKADQYSSTKSVTADLISSGCFFHYYQALIVQLYRLLFAVMPP